MFCRGQLFIYAIYACLKQFISRFLLPLPNLGFSLVGFTAFHFMISHELRHCGTFKGLTMSLKFRFRLAVRCSHLPKVIFSFGTNTTIIADGASMDFPLAFASNCLGQKLFYLIWIDTLFK